MKIADINLILDVDSIENKDEAFKIISELLVKNNYLKNPRKVIEGLNSREKQFSTGLSDGIAIPHASLKELKESKIVIIRLKKGINWNSLDGKDVNLIISILVPQEQSESHFEILTNLSSNLIDQNVIKNINELNPSKLEKYINELVSKTNEEDNLEIKENINVVGVTTCVTGVAHTFMAAKALEQEGAKRGWNVRIEKQGQMTKDSLTKEEIDKADYVIIAKSKSIDGDNRFAGKLVYETEVAEPITKASKVFDDMLEKAKLREVNSSSSTSVKEVKEKKPSVISHLMTGISFMIPYIAMAGIVLGLTTAFGYSFNADTGVFGPKNDFANALNVLASQAFLLYIPILGMFIGNSIAGRKAMAPSAILALVLNQGIDTSATSPQFAPFFNWETMSWSFEGISPALGFLGAIAAGYIVGYGIKYFTKYTDKVESQVFQTILPLLIIPILFTVVPWIFMAFFGYLPLFYLAFGLNKFVIMLANNSLLWLAGGLMGAMICFDLGGPVNKIAMTIGVAMLANHDETSVLNGVAAVAVSIPAVVLFFSWIFNRMTSIKLDEEDKTAAASASLMGFFGITEGAIPFAAKNAKLWMPSFMVAGFIGGSIASFTGVVDNVAMWGGPIIYIAGGFGSTFTNIPGADISIITQTSNWTWTLLYFIPLIVGGFSGFVVANVLSVVYQKNSVHIASDKKTEIILTNKEKITNIKNEILEKKNESKQKLISQDEFNKFKLNKEKEIEEIKLSQKELFKKYDEVDKEYKIKLKEIKPTEKEEYKERNIKLKNELKELNLEKKQLHKKLKQTKEDNLKDSLHNKHQEIIQKKKEITENINYYKEYKFGEKIAHQFNINF